MSKKQTKPLRVYEEDYKFIFGYRLPEDPNESSAEIIHRILMDWKLRGDKIGELTEKLGEIKIYRDAEEGTQVNEGPGATEE